MSKLHFIELQMMIDRLQRAGFRDITEEMKPAYGVGGYHYLCTFYRGETAGNAGPIYIKSVPELHAFYYRVFPPMSQNEREAYGALSGLRFEVLEELDEQTRNKQAT